jgi:hypothetical protein
MAGTKIVLFHSNGTAFLARAIKQRDGAQDCNEALKNCL